MDVTIWKKRGKQAADKTVKTYSKTLDLSPSLVEILLSRGFEDEEQIKRYLNPNMKDLCDPFSIANMEKACDRVIQAVQNQERIVIYGDYDADGTGASSLLKNFFTQFGYPVKIYIPNRLKEGYGMNKDALFRLIESGVDLIVCVDNGIASVECAAYLKTQGVDLVVLDHHEPGEILPEAFAVVDPKAEKLPGPYKDLCGAGLAFKMVQGLDKKLDLQVDLRPYLELASLSTVADLVPLKDENRAIVYLGLKSMNRDCQQPGLRALIDSFKLNEVRSSDIAYKIGPAMNAPGRLGRARAVVKLFCDEMNPEERHEMAEQLIAFNDRRKEIEKGVYQKAEEQVFLEGKDKKRIIVVADESFHVGVMGIAASRLQERVYRPVLIAGGSGEIMKGSCRSVEGFNIYEALKACEDLLEGYGGHSQAAGFSIKRKNLPALEKRINQYALEKRIDPLLNQTIYYDAKVDENQIGRNLYEQMKRLEPTGLGNPGASFLIDHVHAKNVATMGSEGDHLRFQCGETRCVGFNRGSDKYRFNSNPAMVGKIELNCFRGIENIQFNVKDLKFSPLEDLDSAFEWVIRVKESEDNDLSKNETILWEPVFQGESLSREELIKIYNLSRKKKNFHADEAARITGLSYPAIAAGLSILQEEGMICFSRDEDLVKTEICPISGKKDITQNELFRKINHLSKEEENTNGLKEQD